MDIDQLFRRLTHASIGLLIAGAILFIGALAMPPSIPWLVLPVGLVMLIGALTLWAVVLVRRLWHSLLDRPPPDRSVFAPPAGYKCHKCGYRLRGVEGAYCPECGAVRPAPLDDDESA